MAPSLIAFKSSCRTAFQYLLSDFGFRVIDQVYPRNDNPFQVRFGNGTIEILILGESYGTAARIEYITPDGTEVAYQMLEPGWEPFKKHKRMKKGKPVTQEEQIIIAANRIRGRDVDILRGDLARLNEAATRWKTICEKMGWNK